MEEAIVKLERHEQQIKGLQRQLDTLNGVTNEIRAMNEQLISLTSELKHINEHLTKNEHKIEEIEAQPKARLAQIVTAVISALAGGLISAILSSVLL